MTACKTASLSIQNFRLGCGIPPRLLQAQRPELLVGVLRDPRLPPALAASQIPDWNPASSGARSSNTYIGTNSPAQPVISPRAASYAVTTTNSLPSPTQYGRRQPTTSHDTTHHTSNTPREDLKDEYVPNPPYNTDPLIKPMGRPGAFAALLVHLRRNHCEPEQHRRHILRPHHRRLSCTPSTSPTGTTVGCSSRRLLGGPEHITSTAEPRRSTTSPTAAFVIRKSYINGDGHRDQPRLQVDRVPCLLRQTYAAGA